MKFFNVVVALLLAGLLGCADDGLLSVLSDEEDGAGVERSLEDDLSLAAGKQVPDGDMTLFVGEFAYAADPDMGLVPCLDPVGNPATGVALPRHANVDGRAYYLDKTTGSFTTSECQTQADGSLTSAGDWMFIGEGGHRVMGTWTATTLADGSLTGKTVITGGIGSFADATGWTRFAGQIDLTTGTGTFYGKGLISSPKEVSAMGIVAEITNMSESGSISCQDHNGNTTGFRPGRRAVGVGLDTYLGVFSFRTTHERCVDDGDVATLYGTWSYTNAQGDVIRGTNVLQIGVANPWPNDGTITGGEGRFEGITGWMDGLVYWDEKRATQEGVLFMPR